MSNVYMHSNPDPENLKGMQSKKNHTHAHKYSLELSYARTPTHTPVVVVYFPAMQSVHRVAPEVRTERVDPRQ